MEKFLKGAFAPKVTKTEVKTEVKEEIKENGEEVEVKQEVKEGQSLTFWLNDGPRKVKSLCSAGFLQGLKKS